MRWSIAALIAVVIVGSIVVLAIRPPGRRGTRRSPSAGAEGRGRAYRYIWTGTPGKRFSKAELDALARDDPLVVIEKGYGTTFQDWDAAARDLHARDPSAVVLVDFLAGALPPALEARWGAAFDPAWILRDRNGDVMRDCSGGRCKYRVDVSDPAYRRFVEGQVMKRLRAAPYGGVMYDNLHLYDRGRYPDLSDARIRELNAGFRSLLVETRRMIGPDHLLFFNGVARSIGKEDVVDRGLGLLGAADGAQDEVFCYLDNQDAFRPVSELIQDDATYHRLASQGATILESVKVENPAGQADAAHIERYCFGHYLMSYVPGHLRIQFKAYPTQGAGPQIQENFTPEQTLDLGAPTADFTQDGQVLERRFENGWVFVNVSDSPQTIALPERLTLRTGGTVGGTYRAGESYTIAPTDAAYFLRG